MLKVFFGKTENTIRYIDDFFNDEFENKWLNPPAIQNMLMDIDKTKVVELSKGYGLESSIFGSISHRELSGGVKALMLMAFLPQYEYWGTACGDNCAKWILKIAESKDITLAFRHVMNFPEPFEIEILNSGKVVKNMLEYVVEANKYIREACS